MHYHGTGGHLFLWRGRCLECGYDPTAHALLLERDDVARLQSYRRPIVANVINNQFLGNAGVGHGNHVVDRCRPGGKLSAKLLLDGCHVGGVSRLNVIEFGANSGTGNRAEGPANCRTCSGAAKLISDNSPGSGTNQSPKKGTLVRMIRRLTPGPQDNRHYGRNRVLPAKTPHTLLSTLIRHSFGRPEKGTADYLDEFHRRQDKSGMLGNIEGIFPGVSTISRLPASQALPIFPRPCGGIDVKVTCS